MTGLRYFVAVWVVIGVWAVGLAAAAGPATQPDPGMDGLATSSTRPSRSQATTRQVRSPLIPAAMLARGSVVLHLPGIGGYLGVDQRLIAGLKDGGVTTPICVYDWTDNDSGIDALHALTRNHLEAQRIATMIEAHVRLDPTSIINLTSHSGGCGLAIWALEQLPKDVMVDSVLLMAPALSPAYDLTTALRHVRGHVYAFTSTNDSLVLCTGTKLFGTIDGVKSESAGYSGFVQPQGADPREYAKLIARPYDPTWQELGNSGNHVGPMARRFSAKILAPLLQPAQLTATSRPSNLHE